MKKIVFIITFLVTLLIGVVSTKAQSMESANYQVIFSVEGKVHFVDTTSIETLNNGKVVFWSLSKLNDQIFVFSSLEIDCKKRLARVREFAFFDGLRIFRKKQITKWFAKDDEISNHYIYYACKQPY